MKAEDSQLIPKEKLSEFSQALIGRFPDGGIIGLNGELGSGKTTLVREVIKTIAAKQNIKIERVMSPSFVLHQSYEMLKPPVHHFDLYRMAQVTETMLVELEYYEIVEKVRTHSGFLFVEWPELCVDKGILKLTAEINIEINGLSRRYTTSLPGISR
jgi:tRNA threonylcarbamoyl adenosine modification protein YjeE